MVMYGNLPEPLVLLVDRSCDAERIRKVMARHDILTQIPMRKIRVGVDAGQNRSRCLAKPCFNKL